MWYPLMLGEPSTLNLLQFWDSKQNDTSNVFETHWNELYVTKTLSHVAQSSEFFYLEQSIFDGIFTLWTFLQSSI